MPVLPSGWATVDASAVGGPKYLETVQSQKPMWQVVFSSGSQRGDIVVRAGVSLESDEVSMLIRGALVEQSGPQEMEDGLIRMPIVFAEPSAPSKAPRNLRGWVTCDATSQGGPRFFAPVEAPEEPPQELDLPTPQFDGALHSARGGGGGEGKGGGKGNNKGGSWERNRIWRVTNLAEDGSQRLAVVRAAEPFAPDKEKIPAEDNLVKWLSNGDLVEQVGHSKKSRGYMVMPVRLEARMDLPDSGGEPDGWVTRRLVDRDRDTVGGCWLEEMRGDGQIAQRERRPNNYAKKGRNHGDREFSGPGPAVDQAGPRRGPGPAMPNFNAPPREIPDSRFAAGQLPAVPQGFPPQQSYPPEQSYLPDSRFNVGPSGPLLSGFHSL